MIGIGFGGVLNMVLDPVFIFVLDMGTSGAAIATALPSLGRQGNTIITQFRRDDLEVIRIGTLTLRLQLITMPLWGYIVMSNMFTQSIGYGVRSTIISSARQGLFLIPSLLILSRIIGLFGIQLAQPVGGVLASYNTTT